MDFEPLLYRLEDAKRMIGVGTTTIYELSGKGILEAVKSGNRTMITAESLRRYAASLPKADIRTGQPRTPKPAKLFEDVEPKINRLRGASRSAD